MIPAVFYGGTKVYLSRLSLLIGVTVSVFILETQYLFTVPKLSQNRSQVLLQQQLERPNQSVEGRPVILKVDNSMEKTHDYAILNFKISANEVKFKRLRRNAKLMIVGPPSNPTSTFNGNNTVHHVNKGGLWTVKNSDIYLISAIVRNFTKALNSTFDRTIFKAKNVVLNGWLGLKHYKQKLKCCFLFENNTILTAPMPKRIYFGHGSPILSATQFICPIPEGSIEKYGRLKGAVVDRNYCTQEFYLKPVFPTKKARNSVAFCTKITFGGIDAQRILEWMEVQKYLGVSKVVTFFYNLNANAMSVLKHYAKEGFVELLPFDFPRPAIPFRYVGEKKPQAWIDEQVPLYDCVERLQGYAYIGIIDVDEFLIPRIKTAQKLPQFFSLVTRKFPIASGFTFRTELFITDWPKITSKDSLWHGQFKLRTGPMWDRNKNFYIPDRVKFGTVWTHNYTSQPEYKLVPLSSGWASLKHYRSCRDKWIEKKSCFLKRMYPDERLIEILHILKSKIMAVRKKILPHLPLKKYVHINETVESAQRLVFGENSNVKLNIDQKAPVGNMTNVNPQIVPKGNTTNIKPKINKAQAPKTNVNTTQQKTAGTQSVNVEQKTADLQNMDIKQKTAGAQNVNNMQKTVDAPVPNENLINAQRKTVSAQNVNNAQQKTISNQKVNNTQQKTSEAKTVNNLQQKSAGAQNVNNMQQKSASAQNVNNMQQKTASAQNVNNMQKTAGAPVPNGNNVQSKTDGFSVPKKTAQVAAKPKNVQNRTKRSVKPKPKVKQSKPGPKVKKPAPVKKTKIKS